METALSLHVSPASFREVASYLKQAVGSKTDVTGGMESLEEILNNGPAIFRVSVGEVRADVGAYALQATDHSGGRVVWLSAAGGSLPGVDLTVAVLPFIESQARAMRGSQVAIVTRRRGLVKKLLRQGYRVSAITLRKPLS